ncbi:hypothetical protein [Streptomyces avidinii]|uniref:hypothetical protein n=1 Tax=Streptomyces avidinii TaxID=1895 RepID=UPI001E2C401E|nr:hypothetical protein [Streptomyces avidinii]
MSHSGPTTTTSGPTASTPAVRTDGSFTPVPHSEPLTDSERWITGFDGGHGLAPFPNPEGGLVHVGLDGSDVCRVEVDAPDGGAIALRDAAGTTQWRAAAAPGTFERQRPFLADDVRAYVDHTAAWDGDIGAVVRELLDRPPREFYPTSLIFDDDEDPYDLALAGRRRNLKRPCSGRGRTPSHQPGEPPDELLPGTPTLRAP